MKVGRTRARRVRWREVSVEDGKRRKIGEIEVEKRELREGKADSFLPSWKIKRKRSEVSDREEGDDEVMEKERRAHSSFPSFPPSLQERRRIEGATHLSPTISVIILFLIPPPRSSSISASPKLNTSNVSCSLPTPPLPEASDDGPFPSSFNAPNRVGTGHKPRATASTS